MREVKMKKQKRGPLLIILGNLLYWLYVIINNVNTSDFGDFFRGLLLGMSIAINLVGIVLAAIYISNKKKIINKFKL